MEMVKKIGFFNCKLSGDSLRYEDNKFTTIAHGCYFQTCFFTEDQTYIHISQMSFGTRNGISVSFYNE